VCPQFFGFRTERHFHVHVVVVVVVVVVSLKKKIEKLQTSNVKLISFVTTNQGRYNK
jgi:hypothetical protein